MDFRLGPSHGRVHPVQRRPCPRSRSAAFLPAATGRAIDFIGKLAALAPPPRAHLTRFHGIFAPNANLRGQLTPAVRGRRPAATPADDPAPTDHRTPAERRRSMSWAQRLKRVFNIDVTTCIHCDGAVRIVACIEEPKAIRAILAPFAKHGALEEAHYRPAPRALPAAAV